MFVRVLLAEASCIHDRVVVLQFHASDFNRAPATRRELGRIALRDFVLHRNGGFGFKHFLRETNAPRIAAMTHELIRLTQSCRRLTLTEAATAASSPIREHDAARRDVRIPGGMNGRLLPPPLAGAHTVL